MKPLRRPAHRSPTPAGTRSLIADETLVGGQRHLSAGDRLAAVILDRLGYLVRMIGKHVIGALENAVIDTHTFLSVELVDQLAHRRFGNQLVRVAMQHQATARTGREESEVI